MPAKAKKDEMPELKKVVKASTDKTVKKASQIDPSVVGAGLVGAAAGAAVAIALTNEDSRKKMFQWMDDARTTMQKVMDTLEKSGIDVKKNMRGMAEQVTEKVTDQVVARSKKTE
jgi:methylthioribose-1-phosphate isomerase